MRCCSAMFVRRVRPASFQVLANEVLPLPTGGDQRVVALVADPFCEVVGEVEGRGAGRGVFIVDEADRMLVGGDRFLGRVFDDDVCAEQIAVAYDRLTRGMSMTSVW